MKASLPSIVLFLSLLSTLSLTGADGSLRFIENKGQIGDQFHRPRPDVKYVVAAQKFTCQLRNNGFSYQLFEETGRPEKAMRPVDRYDRRHELQGQIKFYRLDLDWLNSNPNVITSKGTELPGYDNYYLAVCPNGVTHVKSFSSVTYHNLYQGIDMKWYEFNGQLKYDYYVKPGGDYRSIQWELKGADKITVTETGELVIETPLGRLVEEAPLVFQEGKKLYAAWKLSENRISFEISGVDDSKSLIIDPLVRAWGTYYGGSSYDDLGYSHIDLLNNLYFTGNTSTPTSLNIATVGSHQSTFGGSPPNQIGDMMLVKMNSSGTRLWSTYYGGTGTENAGGCSSDSQGNIYMIGLTSSTNAISTPGSYQPSIIASKTTTTMIDVFLAKFDQNGTRLWATYYGDSLFDWANGICVDKFDNVYIGGGTEPVNGSSVMATSGSHQPLHAGGYNDGFLTKFNSSGSRLWSTYLGGTDDDNIYYLTDDTLGNINMTGMTASSITPQSIATSNAHQTTFAGGRSDAFLNKFSATGTRLWGTFYGDHSEEFGLNCEVDHRNEVILFGTTDSFLGSNLGTAGTYQPAYGGGNSEVYVAKFSSAGVRRWGTYYGGVGYEETGVGCVSASGSIFLCGRSSVGSTTAVATCGTYQFNHGGSNDCFIAKLDTLGKREWGTFFGGNGDEPTWSCISVDGNNNLYLTGLAKAVTASSIFATSGAHQTTYAGGTYDVFIQRFNPCAVTPPAATSTLVCMGQQAVFQSSTSCVAKWYSDPQLKNQLHTGPNFSVVIQTADTSIYYADESCGFNTGTELMIQASPNPSVSIVTNDQHICLGETTTLTPTGADSYSWTAYMEEEDLPIKPKVTTIYTLTGFSAAGCKKTTTIQVTVDACAAISESQNGETVRVYPNPASGVAYLEAPANCTFALYNINGKLIWQEKEISDKSEIDFSALPAGIYFVDVKTSTNVQRVKIVVLE